MRILPLLVCMLLLLMLYQPAYSKVTILPRTAVRSVEDLKGITPVEFLDFIKACGSQLDTYTFGDCIKGWVREEDIPILITRLESRAPGTNIECPINAIRYWTPTDEGTIAASLILGFAHGIYPPVTACQRDIAVPEAYEWLKKDGWRFVQKALEKKKETIVTASKGLDTPNEHLVLKTPGWTVTTAYEFGPLNEIDTSEFHFRSPENNLFANLKDRTIKRIASDGSATILSADGLIKCFEWVNAYGNTEHALFEWAVLNGQPELLRFSVDEKEWLSAAEHHAKFDEDGSFEYSISEPWTMIINLKSDGTYKTKFYTAGKSIQKSE